MWVHLFYPLHYTTYLFNCQAFFLATVVESADTRDLKALGLTSVSVQDGSSLVCGIKKYCQRYYRQADDNTFFILYENFFYEMVHLGIENAQILCYIIVRKRLRYFNRCKEDNNGISKTDKRSNLLLVTRTYS